METKNYKPFDLEKAKAGAKVMTRDGRPARIICTDRNSWEGTYPVVALLSCETTEQVQNYTERGEFIKGICKDSDLVMCPEKHEGWINIYKEKEPHYNQRIFSRFYDTKEEAKKDINEDLVHLATAKIEWEE